MPLRSAKAFCHGLSTEGLRSFHKSERTALLRTQILLLSLLLFTANSLSAKGIYMTAEAFINTSFPTKKPQPSRLWLTPESKEQVSKILNRSYPNLRVRYWSHETRTAWIFDEIGKELPITIGIIINSDAIESVSILAFRESRGGEVRYPFFTQQFSGTQLDPELDLDRHIDGITGATLSVEAVVRAARLALYLHRQTQMNNANDATP